MSKPSLIHYVLLILVLAWDCDKRQVEAVDFDHFKLVFQWPVTFCEIHKFKCVPQPPHHWTVHGFWPSNFNGNPVSDCSTEPFKENQISSDTKKHMNRIWPNLYKNGLHTQLWSRQWKKHGTCADVPGTRTVGEYFTKAIELANRYNISGILEKNHINKGSVYKLPFIEDAIKIRTGYKPNIQPTSKKENLK
ncbi:uncharacterized protein LOC125675571 isoform X2 [Ostrea edulis]|nr:uncharacterized protein LOC125675571 isoform X2 [Ostrea edulis]